MRFWFAHDSNVPLRRQLSTQIMLAILAGDLAPGERLPSTRALARRYGIHPNTISAAYQELQDEGWVESRRGSGVYARIDAAADSTPEGALQFHIAGFFRAMRELGLSDATVRERVAAWIAEPAADHFLLIDPDPCLRAILLTELRPIAPLPVHEASADDCRNLELFRGALPLCRPSKTSMVRSLIPANAELTTLPINSATTWLEPLLAAAPNRLIIVLSHWRDFLDIARTMLTATGIPAEALEFREAGVAGWQRGLGEASVLLTDAYTSSAVKLPSAPHRLVFPLLAANAREMLAARVTAAKPSQPAK